jgi:nucleotidyltransferase substrate binding protein (TIGR01987 family)
MIKRTKAENLGRAVLSLEKALAAPVTEERDLAGIVKSFEFCYELSGTSLKECLANQGTEVQGPKDVFRKAWQLGLLKHGTEASWLKMIEDRNLTVHTYDEFFAREMVERIRNVYFEAFVSVRDYVLAQSS